MAEEVRIRKRFEALSWALDERMRRLVAASEVQVLGHGGVSRRAIYSGLKELAAQEVLPGSLHAQGRRPGGGRKSLATHDPAIKAVPEELVEPDS